MRYLAMIKTDEDAGTNPAPAFMDAMDRLLEEMVQAGVLVDTGGIGPSADSSLVRLSGGKLTVMDGPFTEAKELVAGYATFEVASREEAVELARRMMQLHVDLWEGWEGEIEVRPVFGHPKFSST